MASDEHAVVRSQAGLRFLNERLLLVTHGLSSAAVQIHCECGRIGCRDLIELQAAEYDAARAHAGRFLVSPGHGVDAVEKLVVSASGRFDLVEAHGRHQAVAAALASRWTPSDADGRAPTGAACAGAAQPWPSQRSRAASPRAHAPPHFADGSMRAFELPAVELAHVDGGQLDGAASLDTPETTMTSRGG
jgi:hypothetical protein